jgi:hypothetical protein
MAGQQQAAAVAAPFSLLAQDEEMEHVVDAM